MPMSLQLPRKLFSRSPDELLALCDLHDNEVGFMFRRLRTKSLIINRLSSVFVVKNASQLYVQRRKLTKSWCPGYYDITFGGLVRFGESYEENAYRELQEELSIENVHLEPLFKFLFEDEPSNSKTWCQTYLALYTGSIKPQYDEVESVSLMDKKEIENRIKKGDKFTPDSLMAYEEFNRRKILEKYHF